MTISLMHNKIIKELYRVQINLAQMHIETQYHKQYRQYIPMFKDIKDFLNYMVHFYERQKQIHLNPNIYQQILQSIYNFTKYKHVDVILFTFLLYYILEKQQISIIFIPEDIKESILKYCYDVLQYAHNNLDQALSLVIFQITLQILKLMKNSFDITHMNIYLIHNIIELIYNEYHGQIDWYSLNIQLSYMRKNHNVENALQILRTNPFLEPYIDYITGQIMIESLLDFYSEYCEYIQEIQYSWITVQIINGFTLQNNRRQIYKVFKRFIDVNKLDFLNVFFKESDDDSMLVQVLQYFPQSNDMFCQQISFLIYKLCFTNKYDFIIDSLEQLQCFDDNFLCQIKKLPSDLTSEWINYNEFMDMVSEYKCQRLQK